MPASEDLAAAATEVTPSSSTSSVSADDSLRQPEAETEASSSETKEKAKSKRNRCFMCRKKVGLTGEYRQLTVVHVVVHPVVVFLMRTSLKLQFVGTPLYFDANNRLAAALDLGLILLKLKPRLYSSTGLMII